MPLPFPSGPVTRVRARAARFPRSYWTLVGGTAVEHFGVGLFAPYVALYLTGPIGASETAAGAVLALWSLTAIASNPLGGVLSDRLGRRPVMLAALAGAGICSVAFGLADSLWVVAVLIAVWSLFEGVFRPAAQAYVADVVEPGLRLEAFGLWRIAANASIALGPPVGALVVWLFSLRLTFVLAGAGYLVYLVILWRGLPESRPEHVEGEPPARFREALSDTVMLRLGLGIALGAYLFAQYADVLGVFLHEERGLAIATWGLVFGINPLLVTALQYPIARWAADRSSRGVLAGGSLLLGAAFLVLWSLEGLGALVAACIVLTFGEMLTAPVGTAMAAELAPVHLRGSYQGLLNVAWSGSTGPAVLIGLWLVGLGQGELMLALGLPLSALAAAAFMTLPAGKPGRSTVAEPARTAAEGPPRA